MTNCVKSLHCPYLRIWEMKYFNHQSPGAVREMCLALGKCFSSWSCKSFIVQTLWVCYVMMLQVFVLWNSLFRSVLFLWIWSAHWFPIYRKCLKKTPVQQMQTLFTLLSKKMSEFNTELNKVSSLVSDSASVRLGPTTCDANSSKRESGPS